jgi:hypothetical protein
MADNPLVHSKRFPPQTTKTIQPYCVRDSSVRDPVEYPPSPSIVTQSALKLIGNIQGARIKPSPSFKVWLLRALSAAGITSGGWAMLVSTSIVTGLFTGGIGTVAAGLLIAIGLLAGYAAYVTQKKEEAEACCRLNHGNGGGSGGGGVGGGKGIPTCPDDEETLLTKDKRSTDDDGGKIENLKQGIDTTSIAEPQNNFDENRKKAIRSAQAVKTRAYDTTDFSQFNIDGLEFTKKGNRVLVQDTYGQYQGMRLKSIALRDG